ncbi:hypothetical protein D3C71_1506660 [compost metagenome]
MGIDSPTPQGEDLVFAASRLGGHIGGCVYEVAEFIQHMVNTHKLYAQGKTRFFLHANNEQFEAFYEDTPDVCFKRVDAFYAAKTAAYQASPEYTAEQKALTLRRAANKQRADEIAAQLSPDFSLLELAEWMTRYIPAVNNIGSTTVEGVEAIAVQLEAMGYVNGEGVSKTNPPLTFEQRVRWLAGQLLSYYRHADGPKAPHEQMAYMAQEAINDHLGIVNESTTSYD